MFSIVYWQLLFLIIPLVVLLFLSKKRLSGTNLPFHDKAMIENKDSINVKFILISAIFIVLALSRPIIKQQDVNTTTLSSNVIFAIDLSYSMNADDIVPSRLTAAKEIIKNVALQNNTDSFALFGFTTNILPLSPLSVDHSIIVNSLEILNDKYILTRATSIETLLDYIDNLEYENPLVFILSDGGDEKLQLKLASNIYPVHMATQKGSKLPIENKFVISQLNPYFTNVNDISFTNVNNISTQILDIINNSLKTTSVTKMSSNNNELFIYPLIIAILFFIVGALDIRPKLLILLALIGINLNASLFDFYHISNKNYCEVMSFEGQYNCAILLYKDGYYDKSLKIFKKLKSNNFQQKSKIYYNMANCYYMTKDYKRAIQNYQKSLQLKYSDNAKYNLSQALFKHNDIPQMAKDKNSNKGDKKFEKTKDDTNSKGSSVLKLKLTTKEENKNVLGSKSYNMINKGYINEKKPW